jgi:hypothetical protein
MSREPLAVRWLLLLLGIPFLVVVYVALFAARMLDRIF